jgi:parvulin-like peptidyl-prolyl isomerase
VCALVVPAGGVASTAASCAARAVPSEAVAVVDSTPILRADLDALLARSGNHTRSLRDFALRVLVEGQVLRVKAAELGIAVDPAKVEARLASIIRRYFGGDRRRYEEQLVQQGLTETEVRSDIELLLLHDAVLARVTAKIAPAKRNAAYARWWKRVLGQFACRIAYAPGFDPAA